jgi:iron complex transport system ATP-binding protein
MNKSFTVSDLINSSRSKTNQQQPAIEMRGVGVLRDGRWILRKIDWSMPTGALAAVLGPNGSGKSTLARVAATHWWPSEGECRVLGEKFGEANLPELRKSIRLVQPAGPYDVESSLTAAETVQTGFFGTLALYGKITPAMRKRSRELLNLVGLHHVANHTYASLSSGEKVRALIARAMASQPRLLILDEPTAGMDLRAREQVLATVQMLLKIRRPPAVLLITHHVEELPPNTAHVLLLSDGRAAAFGLMSQVLRPEVLSPVYGLPVKIRRRAGRYYLEVHPKAWGKLLSSKSVSPRLRRGSSPRSSPGFPPGKAGG